MSQPIKFEGIYSKYKHTCVNKIKSFFKVFIEGELIIEIFLDFPCTAQKNYHVKT